MATLTQTAYYTRKIVRWSIYLGLLLLIVKLGFDLIAQEYRRRNPLPLPKPDVAFGRLPAPMYPDTKAFSGPVRYLLDTIEGTFPESSPSARVYLTPSPPASFLTFSRVQAHALEWGFSKDPETLSPTVYRWTDEENAKMITIDGLTGNFIYRYTYETDPAVFSGTNVPQGETAIREAENLLSQKMILGDANQNLLRPALTNAPTALTYYRYENNALVYTASPSHAHAVRVDFAYQPIYDIPVLPADPDNPPVSILFSGTNDGRRILEVRYQYVTVDLETSATYPVKSSREAWNELQAQRATLIRLPSHEVRELPVRSITFAYIIPSTKQDYLEPAWVFQGEEFLAYVPAVTDEWLASSGSQ